MGNRCVITTEENYEKGGVGVYLHWNGGRDSVRAFLMYCKLKGYRSPEQDSYGWARLCQVVGNFFGGSLSLGIDCYSSRHFNPGDNGVYLIRDWEIVGRKDFSGAEQDQWDLKDMLSEIDFYMPKREQLGEAYLSADVIAVDEIKEGDLIAYLDYDETVTRGIVAGFGTGPKVGDRDVEGVPFMWKRGYQVYLFPDREYRKLDPRLCEEEE